MKQQLLRQISGRALAIMLTLTFTQILVSAQELSANARKIEGVWEGQVTIRDCQTGDPIITFRAMNMYIRGGSLMTTANTPLPATRSSGFGRWQYLGGRRYTDVHRVFQFNPDGTFAGLLRVKRNITLSREGDDFTGTASAELFDANDNLIANLCGTETAKRVE